MVLETTTPVADSSISTCLLGMVFWVLANGLLVSNNEGRPSSAAIRSRTDLPGHITAANHTPAFRSARELARPFGRREPSGATNNKGAQLSFERAGQANVKCDRCRRLWPVSGPGPGPGPGPGTSPPPSATVAGHATTDNFPGSGYRSLLHVSSKAVGKRKQRWGFNREDISEPKPRAGTQSNVQLFPSCAKDD
jgi:hypothetical protein